MLSNLIKSFTAASFHSLSLFGKVFLGQQASCSDVRSLLLKTQELRPGTHQLQAVVLYFPSRPTVGGIQHQGGGEGPAGRGNREPQLQHL